MIYRFNPPPTWPQPPQGWTPPAGWVPPVDWPLAPPNWQYWVQTTRPGPEPERREAGSHVSQPATIGPVPGERILNSLTRPRETDTADSFEVPPAHVDEGPQTPPGLISAQRPADWAKQLVGTGFRQQSWHQNWQVWVALATSAIIIVVVFVVSSAGAGTSTAGQTYSGASLQTDVARTIQDQTGYAATVTCPGTVEVKAGSIVDCSGTSNGLSGGIRVTFQDDKGHFVINRETAP